MGIVADLSEWFPPERCEDFVDGALTYLPSRTDPAVRELIQVGDRFGNHLALVYNRRFIKNPPQTTDELVALAVANTIDDDGDGHRDRYGLVWNFTEPYFGVPFLTGYGAWVFDESAGADDAAVDDAGPRPALDSPAMIAAFEFVRSLIVEHRVTPKNCDYELADALFKTGRAAMIINGDWSWADYLDSPEIDAAVAVLPIVTSTGEPMRPMISPKGFSLNAAASPEKKALAVSFVEYMLSDDVQRRIVEELRMIPARRSAQENPLFESDPTLRTSLAQLERGRLMPVATELRAVWDAMKPNYQGLLAGTLTPAAAAAEMQRDALRKIELMHRKTEPAESVVVLQAIGVLALVGWFVWQRRSIGRFFREWRRNRVAYFFALPAIVAILAVVVYPFFYNVLLSLSNMSLGNFNDWQVVGLQNYVELFADPVLGPTFWIVFAKTIIWTAVNVVFHVGLGLLLAVALNGPIRGKAFYRILLIIPWAVPSYITALTWRGMFDFEYGAVNLLLVKAQQFPPVAWLLQLVGHVAPVNWLGNPLHAFEACIVANVWLGFPFMMIIALGGMQGIPAELYEAARIDRATRWQQFWHITLPLLRPVLLPAATLGAIWTFNNLNVVWLVSNTGEPQDSTHILVSYVYKAVFNLYRYGYGAALSMVIFAILLVFTVVFLGRTRATESVYG
jgi:arabinogalactan oligomer/maltooligosaccharide transport system permease protein